MIDDMIMLTAEMTTLLRSYLTAIDKGAPEWQVQEMRKSLKQMLREMEMFGIRGTP